MAINTHTYALDVNKNHVTPKTLTLGQGDRNGTTVVADVYDGGAALPLDGYDAYFNMLLPDDSALYRVKGSVSGSKATFTIDESRAASVVGVSYTAYVSIERGSSVIASTERIRVAVLKSADSGGTPAEWVGWESRVEAAVRRAEGAASSATSAASSASSAASAANAARDAANTAASSANTAKQGADTATSAANSAASAADTAKTAADTAASVANSAATAANSAKDAANAAASNANSAAAGADTAAQAANAAASVTANVVEEAVRALSRSPDGYGADMAEVGRLLCGGGYVLDGWLYLDGAASGGYLGIPGSRSWGDGWLEFEARGCKCDDAATIGELAAAERRISALESALAALRTDIAAVVRASALDGFVLDGYMVSNGVSASGGLLGVPTGAVAGGYMTVSATS